VAPAQAATQTFVYTGAEQTFTVPAGVLRVDIVAIGGSGASSGLQAPAAQASAGLGVTPGETLYVEGGWQRTGKRCRWRRGLQRWRCGRLRWRRRIGRADLAACGEPLA
jgi:hypothetical protein